MEGPEKVTREEFAQLIDAAWSSFITEQEARLASPKLEAATLHLHSLVSDSKAALDQLVLHYVTQTVYVSGDHAFHVTEELITSAMAGHQMTIKRQVDVFLATAKEAE
jgi:hypothetical protein